MVNRTILPCAPYGRIEANKFAFYSPLPCAHSPPTCTFFHQKITGAAVNRITSTPAYIAVDLDGAYHPMRHIGLFEVGHVGTAQRHL
jgi:hypothetical protein